MLVIVKILEGPNGEALKLLIGSSWSAVRVIMDLHNFEHYKGLNLTDSQS